MSFEHMTTEKANIERDVIRFLYVGIYIMGIFLFLRLVYNQIIQSIFEQDLLWFIPAVLRETEGMSFIKLIGYLFQPWPRYFEMPSVKIYTYFVLSLFGPLAKNFIFVSIAVHFCNSFLLFFASRSLGLNSRVGFFAALTYLMNFAHFHAYIWPMAFQHLIIIFFILLGLNFYLKTDELINSGKRYRFLFTLTLIINLAASFCRFSIIILPVMILAHILLSPKGDADRFRKYDIWFPLFVIYLIYPLFTIAIGDIRIKWLLNPLILLFGDNDTFQAFTDKIGIPIKFSILFLVGLACLLVFRAMLIMCHRIKFRKFLKWSLVIATIFIMGILVKSGGVKRLLIPYNIIVPFVGILASFLQPLQNALLVDSSRPYHFIPLQLGICNFLLSFFIVIVFVKNFVLRNRQLAVLGIFYMLDMIYLYLWNPLTSRYFIYLSPIFCIIFCAVFVHLYTYLMKGVRLRAIVKDVIILLLFVSFCIPNLLAIKLSLFKGKLVNTFLTYDYARAAGIIKQGLVKNGDFKINRKKIYVNGILPIIFPESKRGYLSASDIYNDSARFVFMQVFDDRWIVVEFNEYPQDNENKYVSYFLSGDKVINEKGINVNTFSQLFEEGTENLKLGRYVEAEDLFNKALNKRPFLFNYLIANLNLEDLEWITNGLDLRTWVSKIGCFYTGDCTDIELEKTKNTLIIIRGEINEYIQCFFYMSFLKHVSGREEESRYWFSKIRFLESDYFRLYAQLSEAPLIKSDKQILSFLANFNNASLYATPENYIDRYKFEKFLFRLIFNT